MGGCGHNHKIVVGLLVLCVIAMGSLVHVVKAEDCDACFEYCDNSPDNLGRGSIEACVKAACPSLTNCGNPAPGK